MKKFLKNNSLEEQNIPEEILLNAFRVPQSYLKNASEEKLIVVHNHADQHYDVQITYNTARVSNNKNYIVFVSNKQDDIIFHTSIAPFLENPPIWERDFLHYSDLLKIEKRINEILIENKLPEIKFA